MYLLIHFSCDTLIWKYPFDVIHCVRSSYCGNNVYVTHAQPHLPSMGTSPCFFTIFTKRNNFSDFLLTSLDDETLSKWALLSKETIYKSKFFPLTVDSVWNEDKKERLFLLFCPFTLSINQAPTLYKNFMLNSAEKNIKKFSIFQAQ